MKNSAQFEEVIEYRFKDKELMKKALTHNSFVKEQEQSRLSGNERLEFLGDAFLDAIIGEALYRQFPTSEEGILTKMRAAIVCEKTLAQEGRRLEIGSYLHLSKGEEKMGGRNRSSIIADAMEAVIGAIFLDGGYEEAKKYVLRVFDNVLCNAQDGKFTTTDYKSNIQELLQSKGIVDIHYILEKEDGPDHEKTFYVRLEADKQLLGRGSGRSKKEAEQNAAKDGIERGVNVF